MLTVVFATHNGAKTLPVTLESMTELEVPEGGWQLIAVDNASTDETPEILESYTERLPLEILYQPKRGKNASLNMAIPFFKGELIVFTDDDIIPEKEWLTGYTELAGRHPEVTVFGGRIVPHWPGPEPDAIINSIPLGPAFALHPPDLPDGPVNPGMIWGPNMAVRHTVFHNGYRFNEAVGPSSGNYIMGSETEFVRRLCDDGCTNWFANEIVVKHQIRKNQLTPKWLWRRAINFGKQRKYLSMRMKSRDSNVVLFLGFPRWQLWQLAKDLCMLPLSFLIKDQKLFVSLLWRVGVNCASLQNYNLNS